MAEGDQQVDQGQDQPVEEYNPPTTEVTLTQDQIQWLGARVADNVMVHPPGSSMRDFLADLNRTLRRAEDAVEE